MSEIKVSVIMTVYNGEKYLREAVESILNQTYKGFEFLILDDASTDKTMEILKSIDDKRLKIVSIGKLGRAKGLNYLLDIAQGIYIANLDADDKSNTDRLKLQVKYLEENPSAVLVGTGSKLINSEGKVIGQSGWQKVTIVNELLGKNCPINHSSVMYRLDSVKKAGKYNNQLLKQIDYELWIRLAIIGELHIIPNVLVYRRLHDLQSFERSGFKYQMHAIKIQKRAIRELKLSKSNYIYVFMRYFYYIFRINKLLNRNVNTKIQQKLLKKQ